MNHDLLADVFSAIKNMEAMGRQTAAVPASRLSEAVLRIMKERGYVEDYTPAKIEKKFTVKLNGRINNCNVIKPRFSVKKGEYFKWEKRFLPAQGLGLLILTTPEGVIDHKTAKEKGIGGELLGFVY